MKIRDLFEPINLTPVVTWIVIFFLAVIFFKPQLKAFFGSLTKRPFNVGVDGSGLNISFEAPATPQDTVKGFAEPTESVADTMTLNDWSNTLESVRRIEDFQKTGFSQLYYDISNLGENEIAVLNYEVNNPNKNYFQDKNMLKYLSIASEKFRYLAFYENNQFVAYIKIEKVIKGLASGDYHFQNFGVRLKTNGWQEFTGLIRANEVFHQVPTIQQLYDKLESTDLTEIALVEQGKLKSILNYETVSNALYQQTQQ